MINPITYLTNLQPIPFNLYTTARYRFLGYRSLMRMSYVENKFPTQPDLPNCPNVQMIIWRVIVIYPINLNVSQRYNKTVYFILALWPE